MNQYQLWIGLVTTNYVNRIIVKINNYTPSIGSQFLSFTYLSAHCENRSDSNLFAVCAFAWKANFLITLTLHPLQLCTHWSYDLEWMNIVFIESLFHLFCVLPACVSVSCRLFRCENCDLRRFAVVQTLWWPSLCLLLLRFSFLHLLRTLHSLVLTSMVLLVDRVMKASLTSVWSWRYFTTRLSLPPYPPPPSALSGCDAWKCGMKQNDAPNVRFLTHLRAIWILLCKLA